MALYPSFRSVRPTRAAIGMIMPSVDKVGRYFPLTFAALPPEGTPNAEDWSEWLDMAEDLGRLALDEDAPPERLMPPACPATVADRHTGDTRRPSGGPMAGHESNRRACPSLPCPTPLVSRPCWAISHHRRVRHDRGTHAFLARHAQRNEAKA